MKLLLIRLKEDVHQGVYTNMNRPETGLYRRMWNVHDLMVGKLSAQIQVIPIALDSE